MLSKLFKVLLRLLIRPLLLLLPKDKKLIVFGAWMGRKYSDNVKCVYESYLKDEKYKVVWIVKDKKLLSVIPFSYYSNSFLGVYYQIRASVLVISQTVESDLNSVFIPRNKKIINLWHGQSLKKIGLDKEIIISYNKLKTSLIKVKNGLLSYKFNVVIASNELEKKILKQAMYGSVEEVIVTGFPRNDILKKITKQTKKILFAPTFREKDLNMSYFEDSELLMLNAELQRISVSLYIRLHPHANIPNNQKELIFSLSNVHLDSTSDVYEHLSDYDILIVDFSSLFFDYLKVEGSIIFAPFGLNDYLKNERELYYDYSTISKFNHKEDWNQILDAIFSIYNGNKEYVRNDLLESFDFYKDENATKRVISCIDSLLDK
jgi:CDP-glycerol glycerophosphotransferase (TagB/SpsB family)